MKSIESVVDGLGGTGGEILGGLLVLLVSWAALRAGAFPRALNYLGAVIGVAGILSTVPALYGVLGPFFGVDYIHSSDMILSIIGTRNLNCRPDYICILTGES